MPVAEVKSSWADEVEEEGGALPPPSETYDEHLLATRCRDLYNFRLM